jgi:hypothetical protein
MMTAVSRLRDGARMLMVYTMYYGEIKEGEDLAALVTRTQDNPAEPNASKMPSKRFWAVTQALPKDHDANAEPSRHMRLGLRIRSSRSCQRRNSMDAAGECATAALDAAPPVIPLLPGRYLGLFIGVPTISIIRDRPSS